MLDEVIVRTPDACTFVAGLLVMVELLALRISVPAIGEYVTSSSGSMQPTDAVVTTVVAVARESADGSAFRNAIRRDMDAPIVVNHRSSRHRAAFRAASRVCIVLVRGTCGSAFTRTAITVGQRRGPLYLVTRTR